MLTQSVNECKQDDTINVELVNQLMAHLFLQRAVIRRRRGEPDQAEVAFEDALKWQRQVRPNHELAKLLREFAELKLFKRNLQDAAALLQEAAKLYGERNMLAECTDLNSINWVAFMQETAILQRPPKFSLKQPEPHAKVVATNKLHNVF